MIAPSSRFRILGLVALLAAAPAVAQDAPTLAVLDLQDGGSVGPDADELRDLGKGLAVMLTTQLMRSDRVNLVERDEIKQVLAEHELSVSGLVDAGTAARVGRLLGARYLLFGAYTDVYSQLRIDVRIVDVETGELRRAVEVTDHRRQLFNSVNRLAGELLDGLELRGTEAATSARPVPARAMVLFSQGLGFEDRGQIEEARAAYRQALELHPDYDAARQRLENLES